MINTERGDFINGMKDPIKKFDELSKSGSWNALEKDDELTQLRKQIQRQADQIKALKSDSDDK